MTLTPGDMLNNRYRIVRLLGQGGFGAVYRAWDINLDEPVALKESFETSPVAQRQFQLEAKLLFKLRHDHLPRVHDYFVIPDQGMYLVMDYIEGEDLAGLLQQNGGPLPQEKVLTWAGQVCDALTYLHSQDPPVIHRDIKPANIRITPAGQAMLVDFGIAKVYDPQAKTTVGARAVTPGFSPNEQYLSSGRTDPRSDIYALGATLYMLLTGQTPPEALERSLGAVMPPTRSLNPHVSAPVDAAITHAMETLPEQRFTSAQEFKAALQAPVLVQPARQPVQAARQAAPPAATRVAPQAATIVVDPLPTAGPVPAERHQARPFSTALALISLAACALGLFFLFQVPPESMVTEFCLRLQLSYGLPPWLAGLLLGVSGLGLTAWLLTGVPAKPVAAGLGVLTIAACLATEFILYQAPTTTQVSNFCNRLELTYALPPELTAGLLALSSVLWLGWLGWFAIQRVRQ